MKITLNKKLLEKINLKVFREFGINESQLDWTDSLTIDISNFDLNKLERLKKLIVPMTIISVRAKKPLRELQSWINICENKSPKIQKLNAFEPALIHYIDQSPGHRIYAKNKFHEKFLCYLVTSIRFVPGDGFTRDHVEMSYVFDQFGKRQQSLQIFEYSDVHGKTIPQILANMDIFLETDELRQQYLETLEKFKPIIKQIGIQYLHNGFSTNNTLDCSYMESDQFISNNHKIVIDILEEKKERRKYRDNETKTTGVSFWKQQHKKFASTETPLVSDQKQIENSLEIPIHPILVIFDFRRHMRLTSHVDYLALYKYDKNLAEKLVLPQSSKTLVDTLIEYKEGGFQDIVQGKSGGIIVLLAGPAGVGKTLTAEVFAESKEKPLYTIQASQLGVNSTELEKELQQCLDRAKRWDAVLLIDEADVYIHKRENNINQNAIVGSFLRVLEYHSSFLFMTTNRSDVVDDAIASRCIAKIDYEYPTKEEQKRIWKILSTVSKIPINDDTINKFITNHENISGRDVKNILKLANLISKSTHSPINTQILDHVIQFNPTEQSKENLK